MAVGTVFQITTNGVFATLHSFTYLESGPESYAALVQATNGNFYIACEGAGSGIQSRDDLAIDGSTGLTIHG